MAMVIAETAKSGSGGDEEQTSETQTKENQRNHTSCSCGSDGTILRELYTCFCLKRHQTDSVPVTRKHLRGSLFITRNFLHIFSIIFFGTFLLLISSGPYNNGSKPVFTTRKRVTSVFLRVEVKSWRKNIWQNYENLKYSETGEPSRIRNGYQ